MVDYKFKDVVKVNQSDASAYIGGPLNQYLVSLKCNFIFMKMMNWMPFSNWPSI